MAMDGQFLHEWTYDRGYGQYWWRRAQMGMWGLQDEAQLLGNGNLLLFDNLGNQGFSKVIEFDFFTQGIMWAYEGDAENRFLAEVLGSNQRLPSGNTLMTQSTAGRVFEVAPDGEIVWDFVNPLGAQESSELVAVIPDMVRLPAQLNVDWVAGDAQDDGTFRPSDDLPGN